MGCAAIGETTLIESLATGAFGLAGVEYSNASVATAVSTLLDSGASRVMLREKRWFTKIKKAQYPLQVQYADGNQVNCWYRGCAELPVIDAKTAEVKKLHFKDAWLAEKATFNLVSVHALTEAGYKVMFEKNYSVIYNGSTRINVGSQNRLYYLDLDDNMTGTNEAACAGVESKENTLERWHSRLSHAGLTQIERIAKMKDPPVMGIDITDFTKCMCEACIMSKLKDSSHPTKTSHKATAPYEVLWSDIAGPLDQPTRSGERYVLGIMDEYSRHVWVYMLKTKREATLKFDDFLTRHSDVKHLIKVVSTDRGGEYQSQFDAMLGRHQLKHWETASDCPAARGAIERVWGTIMPMMACNLRYAGMEKNGLNLWHYALQYAVQHIN